MTTAHRPTFDPARGKEALRGPAFHQRLLPAHTQLKYRKPGQGGAADAADDPDGFGARDLRAELLAAEAAHFAKTRGAHSSSSAAAKRPLAIGGAEPEEAEEDPEAKRRRVLEETRAIDADDDSDGGGGGGADGPESSDSSDDDDDSDDSDDDSEAELKREMDRVRRERAQKREKEERERQQQEEEERMREIALGNPLLNKKDYTVRRRWDDDVVFKNQARGTEQKRGKEFTNDLLRSDFHKRFMNKYVR